MFLRVQGEVEPRELRGESLAGDAAHISDLLGFLAHRVIFLIILALISLELGPDSFCHQCQAQRRPREGKVCTL